MVANLLDEISETTYVCACIFLILSHVLPIQMFVCVLLRRVMDLNITSMFCYISEPPWKGRVHDRGHGTGTRRQYQMIYVILRAIWIIYLFIHIWIFY